MVIRGALFIATADRMKTFDQRTKLFCILHKFGG
jgi:hypothetical protein